MATAAVVTTKFNTHLDLSTLTLAELAKLSSSDIESFSSAQRIALTSEQLGALTANQLAALSLKLVPADSFTGIDVKQIPALNFKLLTTDQVAVLSSDQIHALTPTQLKSMTTAQAATLSAEHAAGLTSTQVAAFSLATVNHLANSTIAAISTVAIVGLTAKNIGGLTTATIGALTVDQAHVLTASQVGALSSSVIAAMDTEDLAALTPAALKGFVKGNIGGVSLASLTSEQFSTLTPTQISGLKTAQLAEINAETAALLTSSTLAAMNSKQLSVLSAEAINNLDSVAIKGLNAGNIKGLTTAQVVALNPDQASALSGTQLKYFNSAQISSMESEDVTALQPSTLKSLPTTLIKNLSSDVFAALSTEQMAAFTPAQVSKFTTAQISKMGGEQAAAMSGTQLAKMSSTQLTSLNTAAVAELPANLTNKMTVSGLDSTQVSKLTPDQASYLTSAQISTLTTEQIAGLTSAQVEQIKAVSFKGFGTAVMSALTTDAVQGITSAQLSQLTTVSNGQLERFTPAQAAHFSADAQDWVLGKKFALVQSAETNVITTSGIETSGTVTGEAVAETILSGAGNDIISTGGTAGDSISSGAGNDTITLTSSTAGHTHTVDGGDGTDTLILGNAATYTDSDLIHVSNVEIVKLGATTAQALALGVYATNAGITTVNADSLVNDAALTLTGSIATTVSLVAGDLAASAYTGNLTVTATTGTNSITSGSGNDSIDGGAGNDTINAGSGIDTVTGGAGNDSFKMVTGANGSAPSTNVFDTITDFGSLTDVINFTPAVTINATSVTVPVSGTAAISTLGLATFQTDDDTLAERIVATEKAIQSGTQVSGESALFTFGTDSYVFVSDTVAGVGANDVLVKLQGVAGGAIIKDASGDISSVKTYTVSEFVSPTSPWTVANTVYVVDTSAHIAAAVATLTTPTNVALIDAIDASDTTEIAFTVAQEVNITAAKLAADDTISITDSPSNISTGLAGLITDTAKIDYIKPNASGTLNASAVGASTALTLTGTSASNTITVTGFGGTTFAGSVSKYDVTVTAAAANVTGGAAVDTVRISGLTATGTYALGDGTDVLVTTAGANITGVNSGAATTAETLTAAGIVTMKAVQLSSFTTVNSTAANITLTTVLTPISPATTELPATAFVGDATITLADVASNTLTTVDGLVAAGATLTVVGSLTGTNTLAFVGSAETNGKFNVTGGAASDAITGGSGADTISGAAGNDVINAGAVSALDSIDGGANNDTITLTNPSSNATLNDVTIAGGTETDTLVLSVASTGLTDAGFAHVTGVETLQLTGASSVVLSTNANTSAIATIITGAGNTSINYTAGAVTAVAVNGAATTGTSTITLAGDVGYTLTSVGQANPANVVATTTTGALDLTFADDTTNSAISVGAGHSNLTIAGATGDTITVTGFSGAGKTFTGSVANFDVTMGVGDQNITLGAGDDTLRAITVPSGTINLAAGANVVVVPNAGNISGGVFGVSGGGTVHYNVDNAATGTLSAAQAALISSAAGTQNISVSDAISAAAVLPAAVETFTLYTGGANSVTLGAAAQTVVFGGASADTIAVAALPTVSTVVVGLAAADTISTTTGANLAVAKFHATTAGSATAGAATGAGILTFAGTTTLTAAQLAGFTSLTGSATPVLILADALDTGTNALTNVVSTVTDTQITLANAANTITTVDGNVESGETLKINGATIVTNTNVLTFNGALEADGKFSVTGGAGSDVMTGGAGVDTLDGGLGNDVFNYSTGALFSSSAAAVDSIVGGGDTDTVHFTATAAAITVADLTSRISGVEKITTAANSAAISITVATATSGFTTINLAGDTDTTGTNLVAVSGTNGVVSITGGTGNDEVTLDNNHPVTVDGGAGTPVADKLTLSATGSYTTGASGWSNIDTLVLPVGATSISAVNAGATIGGALDLTTSGAITATMTVAQHNGFSGITAASTDDQITLSDAGTLNTDVDVTTYSVVAGSNVTVGAAATFAAQILTETGTGVTTFALGTGAYTGDWTSIETDDVVKVVTGTDISGNTGLNGGVVIDFQDATATLKLNATQNGAAGMSFLSTGADTGVQTVELTAVDSFTTDTSIDAYTLIGGGTVTLAASGSTATNIAATNANGTTVSIGSQTMGAATYNLAHTTADVISTTTGASISAVNAGATTTAETLSFVGNVTLKAAQLAGFTSLTGSATPVLILADALDTGTNALTNVVSTVTDTQITLANAANTITTVDGNVESGETLKINGATIVTNTNVLTFNGALEADGKFSVTGGAGSDVMTGGAGVDTLDGGLGNDVFNYSTGALFSSSAAAVDSIVGGGDTDTVHFTATAAAITVADLTSRISGVEKITTAANSAAISITVATATSGFTTINLAGDTDTTGTNLVAVSGTNGVVSITGGTGNDEVTLDNNHPVTVDGGAGTPVADKLTLSATGSYTTGASGWSNIDTLVLPVGATSISAVNAGATIGGALDLTTSGAITATMTVAQHNGFSGITAASTDDQITLSDAGTLNTDVDVTTYSVVAGSNVTVGAAATFAAQILTETGTGVTTFALGTGAYTGDWTSIETDDVVKVVTGTDISGNTGLNGGVVIDFQDATATLKLNATQNGAAGMSFLSTGADTGVQTVELTAVDSFTTDASIDAYSLIGGDVVTLAAGSTATNIATTAIAAATTVDIGSKVMGGATYNLQDTGVADVIIAATGASILAVNAGAATTAEVLQASGTVTMTAAQLTGFTGITSVGANITLADVPAVVTVLDTTIVTGNTTFTLASGVNAITLSANTIAAGTVTLTFDGSTSASALTFSSPTEADAFLVVKGGSVADTITGNAVAGTITGGAGADIINVGSGTDTVKLTATGQTFSGAAIVSGSTALTGIDEVTGMATGDSIDLATLLNTFTGAAGTTIAAATGTTVSLVRGGMNAGTKVWTDNGAGADTLLIYDADGASAGTVVEAIVLIGSVVTGTATAGVLAL